MTMTFTERNSKYLLLTQTISVLFLTFFPFNICYLDIVHHIIISYILWLNAQPKYTQSALLWRVILKVNDNCRIIVSVCRYNVLTIMQVNSLNCPYLILELFHFTTEGSINCNDFVQNLQIMVNNSFINQVGKRALIDQTKHSVFIYLVVCIN